MKKTDHLLNCKIWLFIKDKVLGKFIIYLKNKLLYINLLKYRKDQWDKTYLCYECDNLL